MNEQVPVSRLRDWLRKSLSSELSQAERERDKTISEISRALESLTQICSQLSQKAERDMEEKRDNRAEYRAAKAVARLTGIISDMRKSIVLTSAKDTASLRNLQRLTSKVASDAAGARQEWLRQIRPYYIIDMMTLGGHIDKVKRLGEELHSFLVGRGSLLRSLEELNDKLESLSKLELSKQSLSSQKQSLERELEAAEQEEKTLRAQAEKIREDPRMKEYLQMDTELRGLRGELLRTGFSRLGRPLRKLISISERGDYPLPIDVREKTKEYSKKPFATFLGEEDGYPHLKAVLTALSDAVSTGKLALKQREAKKVIQRTQQAVDGQSLARLQAESKNLKNTYDQLLADQQLAELVQQLRDVRKKGRANHTSQEGLRSELQRLLGSEKRMEEQINVQMRNIEAFTTELTGTTTKLELA
jgi:DNA repair exonuclease SbcCD ATPase subunit